MNYKNCGAAAVISLGLIGTVGVAQAQPEPYIGQIAWFGYNFCPRGWTEANGQVLPIAQNTALFSLYGTTYGGDGRTTFALPDLRGRVAMHAGQGPGLSDRPLGAAVGSETATLSNAQMPAHQHTLNLSPDTAASSDGGGAVLAKSALAGDGGMSKSKNKSATAESHIYGAPGANLQPMAAQAIGSSGGGEPLGLMQPTLTLRACVALVGVFPSRN